MNKDIERFIRKEKWQRARQLIFKELKTNPKNHWLLTRLSSTYYEEKKYSQALKISRKALKLMPKCPLVLWDYACALDMTGKSKEAIGVWKKMLNSIPRKSDYEACWEGKAWARSLKNDCSYQIGKAYNDIANRRLALVYLKKYLRGRSQGIFSIYKVSEAKQKISEIVKRDRLSTSQSHF